VVPGRQADQRYEIAMVGGASSRDSRLGLVENVRHLLRAAKVLARDQSVPSWIRWLFVFGLLPIPLFFDELALIVATGLMLLSHRAAVLRAWRSTAAEASDSP
jgi:hypothetical protein